MRSSSAIAWHGSPAAKLLQSLDPLRELVDQRSQLVHRLLTDVAVRHSVPERDAEVAHCPPHGRAVHRALARLALIQPLEQGFDFVGPLLEVSASIVSDLEGLARGLAGRFLD